MPLSEAFSHYRMIRPLGHGGMSEVYPAADTSSNHADVRSDGAFVVTSSSFRGQEDLYVIAVADGSIRQLTNDFARDRAPRWARDNRHIWFYSDRSGYFELWSIDADGSDLRQLTHRSATIGWPLPSPDGARVVAIDMTGGLTQLYDAQDFSRPAELLPSLPAGGTRTWRRAAAPCGSATGAASSMQGTDACS